MESGVKVADGIEFRQITVRYMVMVMVLLLLLCAWVRIHYHNHRTRWRGGEGGWWHWVQRDHSTIHGDGVVVIVVVVIVVVIVVVSVRKYKITTIVPDGEGVKVAGDIKFREITVRYMVMVLLLLLLLLLYVCVNARTRPSHPKEKGKRWLMASSTDSLRYDKYHDDAVVAVVVCVSYCKIATIARRVGEGGLQTNPGVIHLVKITVWS